jgi:hypothetical protein
LPGRTEELTLVVVRGFGQEPMMLLTNLPVADRGNDPVFKNKAINWRTSGS